MHCESVRDALLDFSNGETHSFRTWIIRRHLAACADCAEELASLRRFQENLRRADLVPPEPIPVFVSTRRAPLRRTLAASLAVLLIGSLFLLPILNQSRRNAQNPGAAIAAALGRVNTWHFAGWKQIDGKQVPWEIWGRRRPFLYYERVGDIVTWDNGKERLRVFPPSAALNRPVGLIIKNAVTPATPDAGFQADPAYQSLADTVLPVNGTGFGDGFTQLYQQTPEVAGFRRQNFQGMSGINENKLYAISKRDWLPVTYQLHFENPKLSRDTEFLTVHYDVDLPDAVLTPPAPSGYSVIDFTQPTKEVVRSSSHIVESHGFQVQAEPVGMDKEGNVLVKVRGWLGGNRLLQNTTFTLNASPFDQSVTAKCRAQTLRYLYASNTSVPPGDSLYLPFMPLIVPHALPDTLALDLTASPQIRERASDLLDENGEFHPTTITESLFTANFHWDLPLPGKPVSTLLTLLPPEQRQYLEAPGQIRPQVQQQFPNRSFEFALAEQRRIYYFLGSDYFYTALRQTAPLLAKTGVLEPNGVLSPTATAAEEEKFEAVRKAHLKAFENAKLKFRAKAVSWQQQAILLRPASGRTHEEQENYLAFHLDDIQLLAICYQAAGDTAGCNRTLRQLIQECQPLPQHGGLLRRQAEFALRTGQFPGDADYKGPS